TDGGSGAPAPLNAGYAPESPLTRPQPNAFKPNNVPTEQAMERQENASNSGSGVLALPVSRPGAFSGEVDTDSPQIMRPLGESGLSPPGAGRGTMNVSDNGTDPMATPLMLSRRFAPLFWCQFFSAFSDNFLKNALVFL